MAEKQTNKDRMREIVDSIENGIKELFESDKYRKYLATMSRFHRYSVNNTMLIYIQRPDATHVAGFNKWRDQFGRNVLKGEKGIRIIAPTPYKKKVEEIKTDPETNAPVLDADGKAIIEEKEIRIPMFKVVSVFDVSQTSGKPLPQLAADLSGNVQQYEVFMEALRRASPVPMEIKPVARDTDGFFSIKAQSITIRAGMSEVQTVCAAVHEIAHAKLHDYEHMTELADDGETILVPGEKSRNTEEVEAESISYAVCQYYGIETGENSFGYIATWSKGKELKELRASLETINKTASELITDIDRHFAEICKERGIDRENLAAAEQPSVEAPEAEKLYMVDNDKYIHVQRSDTGIDYTIYDAGSAKVLDGGVLDGTEQQLSTAALEVCKLHNIGGAAPIRLASLELLKDLQEANELPLGAGEQITGAVAVPTDAEDTMLPELEQAVPMPDPTLTVDDMRSYGYLDGDMLPLSKDRAMELLEHDITVYMLYPDNAEEMVFEAEDIIKHDGMFGVTRPDWDAVKGHIPPRDVEQRFLNSPTDSMAIYQLRRDVPVELRFASLGSLAAPPDPANYWRDGEEEKLTQLVFCDISTPKATPSQRAAKASPGTLDSPEIHALESAISLEESAETPFTVYEDVRQKLIDAGMPPEQIAFIHDANTEVKKRELFAKVRSGQVRVLMGSTAKMGAGTNVQDRLVALHDLDCPWRPRDLTQRKGRIERQGNQNKLVHVCRYVTEGTFDAYLWQTVENKQKFISQIMTSKSPVRSCEDVDATALSFAEIKALCAGDPRIKERMDLDIEVSKLKIMKADHNSKQFRLEDSLLKYFPEKIEEHKGFVRGLEADMQTLAAHPLPAEGFVGMEIRGDRLTDKENAGAALLDTCKEVKGKDPVQIGSYRGFTMSVAFDSMWKTYTLTLKGQMTHRVELGSDARGNLVRIENALDKMPERLRGVQEQLENLYNQQAAAKAEVGKPFPQEQELAAKTARLIELDMELNLDGKGQPQPEQAIAKSTRPSVLDRLKAPPVHGTPEKPHKKEMEAR